MSIPKKPQLFLAVDGKSLEEVQQLLPVISDASEGVFDTLDVGVKFNDLMTATNPDELIALLSHYPDLKLFLDPKRADIAETNRNHVRAIEDLVKRANYVTFTGNVFSKEGLYEKYIKPHLGPTNSLGISFLTNLGDKESRRTHGQPARQTVLDTVDLNLKEGFNGVIASAQEAQMLRQTFGHDFVIGTPGIRFGKLEEGSSQQRVTTPQVAIQGGATFLVMGSDILKNPSLSVVDAIKKVAQEVAGVMYLKQPLDNPNIDSGLERVIRKGSVLEMLEYVGAIYNRPDYFPAGMGYVMRESGVITNKYTNFSIINEHPQALRRIAIELADKIVEKIEISKTKKTLIVGAAMGSIQLSERLGESLGWGAVYLEKSKDGKSMIFDRHDLPDEPVDIVICEDTISKGGTAQKMIDYLKTNYPHATIIGVASVGRNTVSEQNFGVPFVSLVDIEKPAEVYHHPDISYVDSTGNTRTDDKINELQVHEQFPHNSNYVGSGKKYVKDLQKLIKSGKGKNVSDFENICSRK